MSNPSTIPTSAGEYWPTGQVPPNITHVSRERDNEPGVYFWARPAVNGVYGATSGADLARISSLEADNSTNSAKIAVLEQQSIGAAGPGNTNLWIEQTLAGHTYIAKIVKAIPTTPDMETLLDDAGSELILVLDEGKTYPWNQDIAHLYRNGETEVYILGATQKRYFIPKYLATLSQKQTNPTTDGLAPGWIESRPALTLTD